MNFNRASFKTKRHFSILPLVYLLHFFFKGDLSVTSSLILTRFSANGSQLQINNIAFRADPRSNFFFLQTVYSLYTNYPPVFISPHFHCYQQEVSGPFALTACLFIYSTILHHYSNSSKASSCDSLMAINIISFSF